MTRALALMLCACGGGVVAVDAGEVDAGQDAGPGCDGGGCSELTLVEMTYQHNVMSLGTCSAAPTCARGLELDGGYANALAAKYADAGCMTSESPRTLYTQRRIDIDCRPICRWDGVVQAGRGCCEKFPVGCGVADCHWAP